MTAKPRYVSDIPAGAIARELSAFRREGHFIYLRTVEYLVGQDVVGKRLFNEDGSLFYETPLREGLAQGRVYEFYESGAVSCVEPCDRGLQNGTCVQWA